MIEQIANLVSEKSLSVAEQEISNFKMENPTEELGEDLRKKIKEHAISHMTFHINSFRAVENADNSIEEQFEDWFAANEEYELRRMLRDSLRREIAKRVKNENPNMTFLERYLLEHKRKK